MSICNVCNRCLFSFPPKIEMAEGQEYFFLKIYPFDPASKFQEVEIASD